MMTDIREAITYIPYWPQINSTLALYWLIPLALYDKSAAQYGQNQMFAD